MSETTLVLVKPGGVQRNLIGEVIRRFEARGLSVAALKLLNAERKVVEEHYAEHVGKPFYGSVCDSLTSAPIVAMAISGTGAVKAVRSMTGATNPLDAAPGTLRGDLALSIEENLIHASADPEAAARELPLWFPEGVVRTVG